MNLPVNGIIWQNNHGLTLIFGHFIQSTCHYLDSRGAAGDERFGGAGTGAGKQRICRRGSINWFSREFDKLWSADCKQ